MKLRRLGSLLLAGVVSLSSVPAHARDNRISRDQALQIVQKINFNGLPKAFQHLRDLKAAGAKVNEALTRLVQSRPAEMTAHLGQTLLFLLTVTGVEVVMAELQRRREGKPTDATLSELTQVAATHVLDSGNTYLAILGASLADLGVRYPAQAISAWLADAKARPILHQSLAYSIRVTGGLLGWEFGATLWQEAALLLETPEEFERSKSLFGMLGGSLRSLFSATPQNAKDAQLLKTMSWNLIRVALVEQELRSRWIDNTFRTRIMNGETAILTAALAAAGVGTMLLPGGGTVVGFILGGAAVLIAINIPEEIKDGVTGGLHSVRMGMQTGRIRTVEFELKEPVRRPTLIATDRTPERVEQLLNWRRAMRSSYLTIALERARLVFKGLFRSRGTPTPVSTAREQLRTVFTDVQEFLNEQAEVTERLAKLGAAHPNPKIAELLAVEQGRVLDLSSFFLQVALELDAIGDGEQARVDFKTFEPRTQHFIKFVETSYARGFNEDDLR